jgi:L-asparaginase
MRVEVLTLGGTIGMASRPGEAVVPRLTGADLLGAVPGLAATGVQVGVADVRALPSASLTAADLREVLARAGKAVADGAAGVVVLQGTDTIEESAYLLDLYWSHEQPLVVTGAMRNPTLAGADGPANLLAAVTVAADPAARGRGCLVAFDDEVHAARWVRKTHSASTGTFASPDTGPVARLVEGAVWWFTPAGPREPLPVPVEDLPPVPLYTAVFDDDGGLLHGLADRYPGLVVAGLGVGHVATWLAGPLGDLAARVPVVLASRTGSGPVFAGTYGYPGSESALLAAGLVSAGMLHPYKARLLLRALLAAGADRAGVAAGFARYGAVPRA